MGMVVCTICSVPFDLNSIRRPHYECRPACLSCIPSQGYAKDWCVMCERMWNQDELEMGAHRHDPDLDF